MVVVGEALKLFALLMNVAVGLGVDWRVVLVVIQIESEFDSEALGPSGEVGLMQIMPREAGGCFSDRPSAEELRNPVVNLVAGVAILRDNLRYYDGDYRRALAAYNLGIAGLQVRGLDDPAAVRYLERFEKAWHEWWPDVVLPWEEGKE